MTTQILLLRGVMPTGKNKVPMAPLRAALEAAGLRDVRTYIQSGNVIANSALAPARLERLVHDVIADRFGGDITVFARTPAYFRHALAAVPYADAAPAQLYFTLLAEAPDAARLAALRAADCAPDRIEVIGDMAYLRCATRYSEAKINNGIIERRLRLAATTRNHNTMSRLAALTA